VSARAPGWRGTGFPWERARAAQSGDEQDYQCGAGRGGRGFAPRPASRRDPGAEDADLVEQEERPQHQQHRNGIGGREERGDDGDQDDGVAAVLHEEARRHEAEGGENRHDQRQLGDDAEPDDEWRGDAEVLVRGDDRRQLLALQAEQDGERARQNPQVGHRRPGREQHHAYRECGHDEAPLPLVQRGGQEGPDLIDHDGRDDYQADGERQLQRDEERIGGAGEHQPAGGKQRSDGAHQQADDVEVLNDPPADQCADHDGEQAIEDAPAQLLEMVEERHLAAGGGRGGGLRHRNLRRD
jgi:hypothetical protein